MLAWVHIVLGAAGLLVGGLFCLQLWRVPDWPADFALAFPVPIVLILSTVWFAPGLVVPIGTLLGGFGFMVLGAD